MPRETTYKCLSCGTVKAEANHWYVIQATSDGVNFRTWNLAAQQGLLNDERFEFVCGQACAHKILDSFLAESQTRAI